MTLQLAVGLFGLLRCWVLTVLCFRQYFQCVFFIYRILFSRSYNLNTKPRNMFMFLLFNKRILID